ncbi:MAG: type II toxin-antitoxin system RelE/ParE family toxin [Meiothermus sp.]|uniref:type II toxin-antitoxin system RelE/ParE family toxin n=1 Tax=Meiothermus sp. TaxID=1955249 RepID=UPI0028CC9355|nr:type II toxin-antitoxin system RelE/ParE family toxin [Meiothermus sp.]MDT7919966.1 type II toxin-antitoxin system RelE/ParE family toxin [Meiothermus sp.]
MAASYQVLLYQDAKGRSQIKEWLDGLKRSNPGLYAKARWMLTDQLAVLGSDHSDCKHIKGPIWELRHRSGIRIYYWRQEKTVFIAAAGEVKQRNKADQKLVEYALKAFQEFNS